MLQPSKLKNVSKSYALCNHKTKINKHSALQGTGCSARQRLYVDGAGYKNMEEFGSIVRSESIPLYSS